MSFRFRDFHVISIGHLFETALSFLSNLILRGEGGVREDRPGDAGDAYRAACAGHRLHQV